VRVVIAEDLFLLRDGLTRMLAAHGLDVTAAVDNGEDLLEALTGGSPGDPAGGPPDVAVVDVRLPPTFTDEGLRAALAARREIPGLPVLVLSQYVEQLYARELLAEGRGGIGYLLKDRVFDSRQFVDAVRRVAAGERVIDQKLALAALEMKESPLTDRETDVLRRFAVGADLPEIAAELFLSYGTVRNYLAAAVTKLGGRNRMDAVQIATKAGWL